MRLRDLDAKFLFFYKADNHQYHRYVDTLAEANGIMFLCPKCYTDNGGPVGTHRIICWFANHGIPDDAVPGPGRWNVQCTCIDDLSFVGPGANSVKLTVGCMWHAYVTNGDAGLG